MAAESKNKADGTATPQAEAVTGPLIYRRMAAILTGCNAIAKSSKNTTQGYTFRGIDAVYNELHPVFANNSVFILPTVISETREERPTKNGGTLNYTIMRVRFRFITTDGSFVECETTGEGSDSGDKSTNKAMSTALKYALFQVFLIPTEGDNDTENASPEFAAKNAQQATATTQKAAQVAPPKIEVSTDWSTAINDLNSVESFNTFFAQNQTHFAKAANDTAELTQWKIALWAMLTGTAKAKGYQWDKNTAMFLTIPKAEAVAA